jgi:excisionase family DNA binding protein
MLAISLPNMERRVRHGNIPSLRLGRRRLIERSAITAFIQSLRPQSGETVDNA